MADKQLLTWIPLTPETMPPIDNSRFFLIWRGAHDYDGGLPVLAKRVQYGFDKAYIRYMTPSGWKALNHYEMKACLWADIPVPAGVRNKVAEKEEILRRQIADGEEET